MTENEEEIKEEVEVKPKVTPKRAVKPKQVVMSPEAIGARYQAHLAKLRGGK